jgi:hypothetical protein
MNDAYHPGRGQPHQERWPPGRGDGARNQYGVPLPNSGYPAGSSPSFPYAWLPRVPQQPPRSIQAAVTLMYVAAGLDGISLIIELISGGRGLNGGFRLVGSAVGVALWLWMAMANRPGKSWARITSTVFFVIDTLVIAFLLFTLRPFLHFTAALGGSVSDAALVAVLFGAGLWVLGLTTIVLLWSRESSDYYAAMAAFR